MSSFILITSYRARKLKERLGLTDIRKAQNRLVFGTAEVEVGYATGETVGLGMIGAQPGKIRSTKADNRIKGRHIIFK